MPDCFISVETMQALSLQPGDLVVAKVGFVISAEMSARLKSRLEKETGFPVIVLDSAIEIGVLRTGEI